MREARDFERMRRQQRYDAYGASRFFPNGAVMQVPPAHTVSRPSAIGRDTASLGSRHYMVSCAPCHGAGGFGGGPIAPNLGDKRPPSLRSPKVAQMPLDTIVAIIADGFGRMPPLGWQLGPAERLAVAGYTKTLNERAMSTDMRADSSMAIYLRQVDSLTAAGASVTSILRLRGRAR
jgi:mono/diheme cytochrome c family protein